MKSIVWFLVFSVLLCLSITGQEYISFPTQDASWSIYVESTCENDSPPDTMLYRLILSSDTTINENGYKKLMLQTGNLENPESRTLGGLREEGKKVYYCGEGLLGSSLDEEVLLYDFTVKVGDTINHTSNGSWRSIVLEIDSFQIGSHYRKRYKLDNGWFYHNPDYVVEGIGSIVNGLLGHISDIPTCGTHYWEHVCLKESDQVVYINPNFSDCNAGLGISSLYASVLREIKIHPNPVSEYVHILNQSGKSRLLIEIYNSSGQQVLKFANITDTYQIPIAISAGFYIVVVKDKNGIILLQEKVIKE